MTDNIDSIDNRCGGVDVLEPPADFKDHGMPVEDVVDEVIERTYTAEENFENLRESFKNNPKNKYELDRLFKAIARRSFGFGDEIAEDIIAKFYFNLFRKGLTSYKYDVSPNTDINEDKKLKNYFIRWFYNNCKDYIRLENTKKRRSTTPESNIAGADTDSNCFIDNIFSTNEIGPHERTVIAEDIQRAREIIQQLKPAHRDILTLAYWCKLSYKGMGATLDIPIGTVKSRLHSAVVSFAELYKKTYMMRSL